MLNKPLCHSMTSHKITQDGKKNETAQNLWCTLHVKTVTKWNTKLLWPDTRQRVLRNLSRACPSGVNSPSTPLTHTKHNSLLGTERSLLRIRTNSKQKTMICLINLSATLWHHTKSPRMGRKTKQHKISGARSTWKLTRNETRNSCGLILDSVSYAINPYQHVPVQMG